MKIRNANFSDSLDLLCWRNDPLTLSMSINASPVGVDQHKAWLKEVIEDPLKTLYIGELTPNKVGICRFDFDPKTYSSVVSINLSPTMRGKGISFELLRRSILLYKKSNTAALKAVINRNNIPSIKIFQRCGFKKISEQDDFIFYELL
jgi:RimJ/RimL family protein N-acetyltransferase